MANNKVQLSDGTVLIDLSSDTVTAADVASGVSFHLPNGSQATGTASGGSSTVATATATPSSNSTSISFSVSGEPIAFAVQIAPSSGSYMSGSSTRYVTSVMSNGNNNYGTCIYRSGNSGREYGYTTFSHSYSNGTLTITSPGSSSGGYFKSGQEYRLIYIY